MANVIAPPPAAAVLPEGRKAVRGWDLSPYGQASALLTTSDPADETWAYLRALGLKSRFVEVATTIHALPKETAEKSWAQARHFIHQAQDYYAAAKSSSSASSPLLNYYGILNLSKFILATIRPDQLTERKQLQHGLRVDGDAAPPREAKLLRSNDGIFGALSQLLTGDMPPEHISVKDTLARTMDVAAEYEAAWKEKSKLAHGSVTRRTNADSTENWLLVDLLAASVDPNATVLLYDSGSFKDFTPIASPRADRLRFQSNLVTANPDDPELRRLVAGLRPYLGARDAIDETGWTVRWRSFGLPYALDGGAAPLPEMSAIFAISFYLSDIVRYHPDVIADDSISMDSWVLETFNRSSPAKFVSLALNVLLGADVRMLQS